MTKKLGGLFSLCFTILVDNFQNKHSSEVKLVLDFKTSSTALIVCSVCLFVSESSLRSPKDLQKVILFSPVFDTSKESTFWWLVLVWSQAWLGLKPQGYTSEHNTTVSTRHGLCRVLLGMSIDSKITRSNTILPPFQCLCFNLLGWVGG